MKTCCRCSEEKLLTAFHRSAASRDGHHYACKACVKLYSKKKYHADPQVSWSKALQFKYGITAEDYEGMLSSQAGVCAICREPCGTGKRLAVDHQHSTGKVRGLLCQACNTGIGKLREDPKLLAGAIHYLNVHNG